MTDWGQAAQIGAQGFITVFITLGILSLTLWITSLLLSKIVNRKQKKKVEKKD
jgi:hypothetical protein